ncbi:MAG: AMP-binding protein, partial [Vicinamibacterales bacterium]
MAQAALHRAFEVAASRFPDRTAVVEPDVGFITYGQLENLANRFASKLSRVGVRPGDRVGMYLRKSIDGVATMYAILKCGAAYVPVDPGAPPARNAYIMHNCDVRAVVTESRLVGRFREELGALEASPEVIALEEAGGGEGLRRLLDDVPLDVTSPMAGVPGTRDSDLAYILYTSGSTGKPKGVMLSHENAVSFVDWCSEVLEPTETDRFSSHAPFHFDLSILDVHVCLKHGAALVLIGEEAGKDPMRLASLISREAISVWYSAPSILSLLAQFGNLSQYDFGALRLVLFAGEVFPVKHLRTLASLWPERRYFNLYGPTETNVCTYYEVPLPIAEDRTVPYPIGFVCSHLSARVIGDDGKVVVDGGEGELCIAGRGVMQGYWGAP